MLATPPSVYGVSANAPEGRENWKGDRERERIEMARVVSIANRLAPVAAQRADAFGRIGVGGRLALWAKVVLYSFEGAT